MTPVPLLSVLLVAPALVQVPAEPDVPNTVGAAAPTPPQWVVDGVPDTVWMLVEATYAEEDNDRVKEMLREAEVHARAAVVDHEGDIGRRLALAVVLGRRADKEGGRTSVRAASQCHEELEIVLGLDPEHPQARHLMGRIYAAVRRMGSIKRWIATNLLGGGELKKATWEAAEEHLLFAEATQPEVSDYHLQLANLYRDTDRHELALDEVGHVFVLPANTPFEVAVLEEAVDLELRLAR